MKKQHKRGESIVEDTVVSFLDQNLVKTDYFKITVSEKSSNTFVASALLRFFYSVKVY